MKLLLMFFLSGLIYVAIYLKFGLTIYFYKYGILSTLLIIISINDYRYKKIPNRLILVCLGIGIFFSLLDVDKLIIINNVMGLVIGGAVFLFIAMITEKTMGKEAIGGGDVKLIGAIGLFVGWRYTLSIIYLSFIIGGIISSLLLILKFKNRKDDIAFGPFISIATITTILSIV